MVSYELDCECTTQEATNEWHCLYKHRDTHPASFHAAEVLGSLVCAFNNYDRFWARSRYGLNGLYLHVCARHKLGSVMCFG